MVGSFLLFLEPPLWLHNNHAIFKLVLPTNPLSKRNSKTSCSPERHLYMIQLTFMVAWEVCVIGEPCLNWHPDTDNEVGSDGDGIGMSLASSTEDYVVCKSCLISAGEGREEET